MMQIRKASDRGHAEHGWLDSFHTFSFADYYDPRHMGFSSLRVINEDRVAPGMGFGSHPHRDMEILSYVLEGELQHQDSLGNGRIIRPGEFQYMAAGTGVMHSEFNPSSTAPAHFLQIWIQPAQKRLPPRYAELKPNGNASSLIRVASPDGADGSIQINQDASVFLARLDHGALMQHSMVPGRQVWVQVTRGNLEVNGARLEAGDGAALSGELSVDLKGLGPSEALVFDLN